jgi:autotransporter-associated beta strand protein
MLRQFLKTLPVLTAVVIALGAALLPKANAAGETVTINTLFGGTNNDWVFANSSGTATDGYTVRIGAFSESQSEVLSLSYNRGWVNNRFQVFGSGSSATTSSTVGSFVENLTNADDFFKGKQAWIVYSDNAALTSSSNFGVVSSSDASYTIASANPFINTLDGTFLQTSEGGVVGFGSVHTTDATTGTIRVAAAPATNLYWDAENAGLGGTGTWSTTSAAWTTDASGVSGAGPYAWGTTSAGNYTAGDGLTAYFGGTAGTVTVTGTVQAHSGITVVTDAYFLSSGTINLAGASAAANTLNATTGTTTISATLTGSNGMTKAGAGTIRLDGANTFTGTTTIDSGTLQANLANALQSTSGITVNSGGSLLVSASNAVNNSAGITLDGGTLAIAGITTESVGALSLSSNSVIDLGAGDATLTFASLTAELTSSTQLSIWNYSLYTDQIFITSSTNVAGSLSQISFYSGAGTGFLSNGFYDSGTGELYAVPEPEVYATALLLLLGAAYHLRRRVRFSRQILVAPQS